MKKILAFVTILINVNCFGQNYPKSDFSPYPIPTVNSNSWYRLETSKNIFSVSLIGGQLQISKWLDRSAKELPLVEGKVLALDLGEWGGGLYYKPDDTSKDFFLVNGKTVNINNNIENNSFILMKNDPTRSLIKGKHGLIAPGNIKAIIPYDNGWLFTQGGKSNRDKGALFRLSFKKDSFMVSKICDLDGMPEAMTLYKRKIYILTPNSLYSIDGKNKQLIASDLLFDPLNPNSIAVTDENIFIGMRAGYATIDSIKKDLKFYIYNN